MPTPQPPIACRFAPSTTGDGHPGTLLAALLAYSDCQQRGGTFVLRLEDLDPQRCRPQWADSLCDMLRWMDIHWDICERQSEQQQRYHTAMDTLAAQGSLYACSCSRATIRSATHAHPLAQDGGRVYPQTCRQHTLAPATWRSSPHAIRFALPDTHYTITDAGEHHPSQQLSQHPLSAMGDPILRRADHTYAYHLVAVVDDAAQHITHIVRGNDLATSTAIQCALQEALNYPRPQYRHHFLLLEQHGNKLAKLHQSINWQTLKKTTSANAIRGILAHACNLQNTTEPRTPSEFQNIFSWQNIRQKDLYIEWS